MHSIPQDERKRWMDQSYHKKAKGKVRTRPHPTVISIKGNLSHAEILRKVKATPDLNDLTGTESEELRKGISCSS